MTTFARSGYLRRAMDVGIRGYVLKDAPIDDLVAAVRRVHAGEHGVDPSAITKLQVSNRTEAARLARECGWL